MSPLNDPAQVEAIWPHLQDPAIQTSLLPDACPQTLAELAMWLMAPNLRGWLLHLGDLTSTVGLFIFNDIQPHESALCHVFVWRRDGYEARELVEFAKVACGAVMQAFDLYRLNGLTTTSNLPARIFLGRVGFKVEGTLREVLRMQGFRADAWISGMTRGDLRAALATPLPPSPSHDTLEEAEVRVSS
jgi:RimJ/RimL family protein N-acetyltransferase